RRRASTDTTAGAGHGFRKPPAELPAPPARDLAAAPDHVLEEAPAQPGQAGDAVDGGAERGGAARADQERPVLYDLERARHRRPQRPLAQERMRPLRDLHPPPLGQVQPALPVAV